MLRKTVRVGLDSVECRPLLPILEMLCAEGGWETAPADIFSVKPRHPYTKALLAAIPLPDPQGQVPHAPLEGDVPSPVDPPPGCNFSTRCPRVMDRCSKDAPPLFDLDGGHLARCWLHA